MAHGDLTGSMYTGDFVMSNKDTPVLGQMMEVPESGFLGIYVVFLPVSDEAPLPF